MKSMASTFSTRQRIIWITFFSIAMGYLETAVVVYLRALYYPEGFDFPLVPISQEIAITEFWREAATMIMLLGIGWLTGRTATERFAYFLMSFAVWDLFYYVFLYVLLGWPSSLLTWDVLFLIPVPWVGPVLAPVIITILMIILALAIIFFTDRLKRTVPITGKDWSVLILGSLIVILSWTRDYFQYVGREHPGASVWTLSSEQELFDLTTNYVPQHFNWPLFSIGAFCILVSIALFTYRNRQLMIKGE